MWPSKFCMFRGTLGKDWDRKGGLQQPASPPPRWSEAFKTVSPRLNCSHILAPKWGETKTSHKFKGIDEGESTAWITVCYNWQCFGETKDCALHREPTPVPFASLPVFVCTSWDQCRGDWASGEKQRLFRNIYANGGTGSYSVSFLWDQILLCVQVSIRGHAIYDIYLSYKEERYGITQRHQITIFQDVK